MFKIGYSVFLVKKIKGNRTAGSEHLKFTLMGSSTMLHRLRSILKCLCSMNHTLWAMD